MLVSISELIISKYLYRKIKGGSWTWEDTFVLQVPRYFGDVSLSILLELISPIQLDKDFA